MATGAGLPVLAAAVTVSYYFLIVLAFPPLVRRLPRSSTAISIVRVRYHDGRAFCAKFWPAPLDRDSPWLNWRWALTLSSI